MMSMFSLPDELQCVVMSYLTNAELYPLNKMSEPLFLSNVIWKPRVIRRFGPVVSNNYFREYAWQLQLERHQFCYKRQWTLGCVGRITPLSKPAWMPAVL